jgi:hypothetical protein
MLIKAFACKTYTDKASKRFQPHLTAKHRNANGNDSLYK